MRSPRASRVATGIYRDAYGYRVCWQDRGHQREKRFPPDVSLDLVKAYRARQVKIATPGGGPKTGLARDLVRFLRLRKGRPAYKAERSQLRAWLHLYPRLSRWALTRAHVQRAVAHWQQVGYSAQEIRHRVRLLRQVYRTLDGPTADTPCDGVTLPPRVKARPVPVPDDLIQQIAVRLLAAEIAGRLRDSKTRARYWVLATTGQRPAQVMRARPADVNLTERIWWVRPAKGDAGSVVYLNDDMRAAWELFIRAQAWGRYCQRSFAKTLQRNGWPKGIRPYTMRHSVGMALSARGVDLGDIQAHMGHTDPRTTRAFYVPALLQRQQAASTAIDGRLGPAAMGSAMAGPHTKGESAEESATIRTPPNAADPAPIRRRIRNFS